jgi:4-hydroxybenzoate polyprenyltransferase
MKNLVISLGFLAVVVGGILLAGGNELVGTIIFFGGFVSLYLVDRTMVLGE